MRIPKDKINIHNNPEPTSIPGSREINHVDIIQPYLWLNSHSFRVKENEEPPFSLLFYNDIRYILSLKCFETLKTHEGEVKCLYLHGEKSMIDINGKNFLSFYNGLLHGISYIEDNTYYALMGHLFDRPSYLANVSKFENINFSLANRFYSSFRDDIKEEITNCEDSKIHYYINNFFVYKENINQFFKRWDHYSSRAERYSL